MRVLLFCLLSLLAAVSKVKGQETIHTLCGREFVRAVIYTCGGSRWRRILSEEKTDLPDGGNPLNSQTEDNQNKNILYVHGLWDRLHYSVQERRDLKEFNTAITCCKSGCSSSVLKALC
uniref:Insulin-like peptide INSL5 n=1 Tax=Geotrypetes seraphini TaxID=260995 RepID=A0A6P8NLF5_GEOSA|nr:insulin-like peptide INSL5 [Geotrypetes seraphini]